MISAEQYGTAPARIMGLDPNLYRVMGDTIHLAPETATELHYALQRLARRGWPEVVTICGSSKFKAEILAAVAELTMAGALVVSLGMFGHHDYPDIDWSDASELKRMLDELHRRKIDMADRVHVVAPGGYIGTSTRREIAYAREHGKPVTFSEPVNELAPSPEVLAQAEAAGLQRGDSFTYDNTPAPVEERVLRFESFEVSQHDRPPMNHADGLER